MEEEIVRVSVQGQMNNLILPQEDAIVVKAFQEEDSVVLEMFNLHLNHLNHPNHLNRLSHFNHLEHQ